MLLDEETLETLVDEVKRAREIRAALRRVTAPWKPACRYASSDLHVIGVDGSFAIYGGDKIEVIVVKVAAIELLNSEVNAKVVGPFPVVLPVSHTGRVTRETAEELTATLEVLTLHSMVREKGDKKTIAVIDGPIVDPPYTPAGNIARSILAKRLGIRYEDYHSWRAALLKDVVRVASGVVGYVKRVSSINPLSSIARLVVGASAPRTPLALHSILDPGEATKPLEPLHPRAYRSIEIGVVYWRQAFSRLVEVEVAPKHRYQELMNILSCLVTGDKPPLPVLLAHEKSKVSVRLAQALYRLAARSLEEKLKEYGIVLEEHGGEEATLY